MNSQSGMPTSPRSARNMKVVYPAQGIGTILGIEKFTYDGETLPVYIIAFEEGGTTRIPVTRAEANGLRPLADESKVKAALAVLAERPRRLGGASQSKLQQLERRLRTGDLVKLAEIVRDVYVPPPAAGDDEGIPLSPSRRRLYERALRRLAREIALVRGLSPDETKTCLERRCRKELFWLMPDLAAAIPDPMPLAELLRRTSVRDVARGSGRYVHADGLTPAQLKPLPLDRSGTARR